jgi:hypothetical protein
MITPLLCEVNALAWLFCSLEETQRTTNQEGRSRCATRRWCGQVFSVCALELLSTDKNWRCPFVPEICTLGIIDIGSIAELLVHITDVLALLAVELQFLF